MIGSRVGASQCRWQQFWRNIFCRLILDVQAWSAAWTNGMGSGADQRGHSRAGFFGARSHAGTMARRCRTTPGMGREERAVETHGTDSGAFSHAEALWKAMALRGVWQARRRWCSEGKTGTHGLHGV